MVPPRLYIDGNLSLETNATSWPVDTQPEPLQSGAYTCVVTDANGNQIITNPANLTVTPPQLRHPSLLTQLIATPP